MRTDRKTCGNVRPRRKVVGASSSSSFESRMVLNRMGVRATLIPIPISVIPWMPPWLYHRLTGALLLVLFLVAVLDWPLPLVAARRISVAAAAAGGVTFTLEPCPLPAVHIGERGYRW